MKTRLAAILLAVVLAMATPLSCVWAASGDLDEILNYRITVDVNDDATLNMVYHVEWKVLDSTSDGPLTWVKIGIPNKHYSSMEALSRTIKDISYSSSGGSYARIDLDRAYRAGEVVTFDFRLVQDYMYQVGRDNEGEAVYEFTPGWFDDIVVDNLEIRWNGDLVERITPAAVQDGGYYTWNASLAKGKRFTVTVAYPDDAFAFDIDKTIENGTTKSTSYSYDPMEDVYYFIGSLIVLGLFIWGIVAFFRGLARGVAQLFEMGSGFSTGKKITRTKVVYYPVCQGCGAARPEGKDTCEYCGRSFIESEETVTEEDIPPQESAIKKKTKEGEYAYSTEPNTYLRVHVVPIIVSSGGGGSRHSSSGSSRSCACASSCACACGCACACACAGGGRAGCSTKDFYSTDLKLSQLECRKENR